jgi:hypothetical protein
MYSGYLQIPDKLAVLVGLQSHGHVAKMNTATEQLFQSGKEYKVD